IEFFNFGNEETYQFVDWLLHGGEHDPKALIDQAFREAERREDNRWIDEDELDVCDIVCKRLWERLDELVLPALGLGADDAVRLDTQDSLMKGFPLAKRMLVLAARKIDTDVAAEALLRWAGKWNPSKERP